MWAQVRDVADGEGVVEAEVQDDKRALSVWAVVYKPSYAPPDPEEIEEMLQEDLPTVALLDQNGDGVYSGVYEGFDELGEYRVVGYAVDDEANWALPAWVMVRLGRAVYLPVLMRSN